MSNVIKITEDFDFSSVDDFTTKKLEGHITILKTGLPISDAYLINPSVYDFWKKNGNFPPEFNGELDSSIKNILGKFKFMTLRTCFRFENFENPRALSAWRNLKKRSEVIKSITEAFREGEKVAKINNTKNYKLGLILMGRVSGEKGGVIAVDAEKQNSCMIDACWGDNLLITDGEPNFDTYFLDKNLKIVKKIIRKKEHGYFFKGQKKVMKKIGSHKTDISTLTEQEARKLAEYGFKAADFHRSNVEIEFLISKEGRIETYELQLKPGFEIPYQEEATKNKSMISGISVFPGTVRGKVKIIKNKSDLKKIKEGDIAVFSQMMIPHYLSVIKKISAIITDTGGITSHLATVSRELKIPCIVGTGNATKILKDNSTIAINTKTCEISEV